MAGLRLHVPTGEVSLAASTAKTVFTLTAPSNHRVLIRGIEIFFKGTSSTDTPVKIEISRITTDGGTASTPTVAKNDENSGETPLSTVKSAYTVEPSTFGANAVLVGGVCLGGEAVEKPAKANDIASVTQRLVV